MLLRMVIPVADVPWPAAVGIAVISAVLSGIVSPLLVSWVQGRRSSRLEGANRAHLKKMLSGERHRLR